MRLTTRSGLGFFVMALASGWALATPHQSDRERMRRLSNRRYRAER